MTDHERNYQRLQELLKGRESVWLENEPHMPLNIERLDDSRITLAQYGKLRGHLIRDPEIVFLVAEGKAVPVCYRNDYAVSHYATVDGYLKHITVKPNLYKQLENLVKQWWQNLENQGVFVASSQEVSEGLVRDTQGTLTEGYDVGGFSVSDMLSAIDSKREEKANLPPESFEWVGELVRQINDVVSRRFVEAGDMCGCRAAPLGDGPSFGGEVGCRLVRHEGITAEEISRAVPFEALSHLEVMDVLSIFVNWDHFAEQGLTHLDERRIRENVVADKPRDRWLEGTWILQFVRQEPSEDQSQTRQHER